PCFTLSPYTTLFRSDVEHVVAGVADRLGVEGLGLGSDRGPPGVEVVGVVDEGALDAHLGQRVVEEVVGAAVERGGGHDVAAGLRSEEHTSELQSREK